MNRWQTFRSSDDSIPTTPYEAGVFLQNARDYLKTYGYATIAARFIINDAHGRVNETFIADSLAAKEVAA